MVSTHNICFSGMASTRWMTRQNLILGPLGRRARLVGKEMLGSVALGFIAGADP
jgi:hypothetical protein